MRYKCCLQGEKIASVKKTVDVLINFFDREDVQRKKRVEKIEDHKIIFNDREATLQEHVMKLLQADLQEIGFLQFPAKSL